MFSQIVGRSSLFSIYLRTLERGAELKTTALLVSFLSLEKPLKNL